MCVAPRIALDDPTAPPWQCTISESAGGGAILWNPGDDFPLYGNGRRVTELRLAAPPRPYFWGY